MQRIVSMVMWIVIAFDCVCLTVLHSRGQLDVNAELDKLPHLPIGNYSK